MILWKSPFGRTSASAFLRRTIGKSFPLLNLGEHPPMGNRVW
jgi:hypothetical protein